MMRFAYLLFAVFVHGLLQSWAITQCENDQIAYVQTNPKVLKGALEQEAATRCDGTGSHLNSGVCGPFECGGCDAWGSYPPVPTDASGFPNGRLDCGGQSSCGFVGNPVWGYAFKNPSDYLVCGLHACTKFGAIHVGGLCCLDGCVAAGIQLASTGGDVCCHKTSSGGACTGATFTNVRNMACFDNTCKTVKATLTGDLVVSGGFPGEQATFNFKGSSHCIRSVDPNLAYIRPFVFAKFNFEQAANIVMQCQGGTSACQNNVVKLTEGSCFHVKCESAHSCYQLQVLPFDPAKTNFQCYCSGNTNECSWTDSYSYCTTTTGNPCGTNICPGSLPACVQDEAAVLSKTVDCTRLAPQTAQAPEADNNGGAGTVQGDPHLSTLDGRHYTLMQQGNFLLWGFSGYETEVLVKESVKKVPVDFEIFAHYAGHASFTKGLLFVDKSGMPKQTPQALEVTAKDCRWHHRDAGDGSSWRPVESALLNLADSDGSYGSFNLSMSKSNQRKLEISINHQGNVRTLAQLWVSCRAGHQLSAKIKMPSKKDLHFVMGELAPGRLSLAAATGGGGKFEDNQMATDPEFALTSDWGDLGGSPTAASYFKEVDATGPASAFKACGEAEKEEHSKTCQKHLEHLADSAVSTGSTDWYQQVMTDCIFDLCRGGDETSAELAAEIFSFNA